MLTKAGLPFAVLLQLILVRGDALTADHAVERLGTGGGRVQEGLPSSLGNKNEMAGGKKQFASLSRSWSPVSSSSHDDLSLALSTQDKVVANCSGVAGDGGCKQHKSMPPSAGPPKRARNAPEPRSEGHEEQDSKTANHGVRHSQGLWNAVGHQHLGLAVDGSQDSTLDHTEPYPKAPQARHGGAKGYGHQEKNRERDQEIPVSDSSVDGQSRWARRGSWKPHGAIGGSSAVRGPAGTRSVAKNAHDVLSDIEGSSEALEGAEQQAFKNVKKPVRLTPTREPAAASPKIAGPREQKEQTRGSRGSPGGFWLPGMGTLSSPAGVTPASPSTRSVKPGRVSRGAASGWPEPDASWKPKYDMTTCEDDFRPASVCTSASASASEDPLLHVDAPASSPESRAVLQLSKANATKDYRRLCGHCGSLCTGAWVMGYDKIHCSQKCLTGTEEALGGAAKSWDSFEYQRAMLGRAS